MNRLKSIVIVGGSSGAKIATNIFNLSYPDCNLFYVECFEEELQKNQLYINQINAII